MSDESDGEVTKGSDVTSDETLDSWSEEDEEERELELYMAASARRYREEIEEEIRKEMVKKKPFYFNCSIVSNTSSEIVKLCEFSE